MPSYKNFSQDVQYAHKIKSGELKPVVNFKDPQMMNSFDRNLDKWIYFSSWSRWYPDLFLDMIKPDTGGIELGLDQRVFLRGMLRFSSIYGTFPRAFGKCSVYATHFYTSEGMLQLSDFVDDREYFSTDVDTINRYGEREHTYLGANNGYKPTLKIKTNYGYDNEVTYNHKLLVMGKDGKVDWKRADEIKIGDYLCVNKKNDIWGHKTDLSRNVENADNSVSNMANLYDLPSKNTPDFSYLIGLLVGDGCTTLDASFGLTSADSEIYEFFIKFMKNNFNYDVQNNRKYQYTVYSKHIRNFLYDIGIGYDKSYTKYIPKFIRQAPKECCRAFLQGLFDTDGGVENKSAVCLSSTSEELLVQVQLMLLNFGIVSNRSFQDRGKFNHWRLYITGENLNYFYERVGFRLTRKQERLKSILKPIEKINTNKNIIPHQKENLREIFSYLRDNGLYIRKVADKLHNSRVGENQLTYNKLNLLMNSFDVEKVRADKNHPYLIDLYDYDYFYDEVVTIEASHAMTADINMPQTNSWIANGVVSHNTFLEVLSLFLICLFYPNIEVAMTAQTQANAAKMLKDKYNEIIRYWPILADEINGKPSFSKDSAEIKFNNNSILNVLANNQNSKGQRRKRINIEESALLDAETFDDALKPIVDFPRYTVGKYAMVNPEEISQRINFFTTSGRLPLYVVIRIANLMNAQSAVCMFYIC